MMYLGFHSYGFNYKWNDLPCDYTYVNEYEMINGYVCARGQDPPVQGSQAAVAATPSPVRASVCELHATAITQTGGTASA